MIDCIAVVSGGMDSVTLLHYLVKQEHLSPAVISFSYGQKHSKEIDCAILNVKSLGCNEHRIIDLSGLVPLFEVSSLVGTSEIPSSDAVTKHLQPSTYVPNRNMIFLAIAVAWAESLGVNRVYYGAQAHDLYGYWDTTPDYVSGLNRVYGLNSQNQVQIVAPFIEFSKRKVLETGINLNVDYSTTWSCYKGLDKACGQCPTCAERLQAFAHLGLDDPIPYE